MWEPLLLASSTPREPDFRRGHMGLGWRIDRYRDTVRVAHGGDLNGFTSRVVLLPQKAAGLAVLVNHGDHPLPNALTPDLLDRLLGLAPEDQASRTLARRKAEDAAAPAPAPDLADPADAPAADAGARRRARCLPTPAATATSRIRRDGGHVGCRGPGRALQQTCLPCFAAGPTRCSRRAPGASSMATSMA